MDNGEKFPPGVRLMIMMFCGRWYVVARYGRDVVMMRPFKSYATASLFKHNHNPR